MTSIFLNHFDDLLATPEDAEQLSNTILQLAMQGKLGTQDSSDEPASEILKRVRSSYPDSEKGLTVREDEIPFPLPKGWEWVRLPEVTDNWGQKKPDKEFTYIDVSSIDNQFGIVSDELAILYPENAPSRARKIVKERSVIYSTVRQYLLNIAIIDRDIQPEPIVSTAFYVMHPVEGLDARFLYLYLRSKYFTKFVESQMTGMAYPAISDGKMSLGIIPLPPYAEQQRIVARVEELFVQTRALAKELAHSQTELDGLNKSALSHLLASETPPGEFNQHWHFVAEHFDLLFQSPEHITPLRQSILELAVRGKLTRREAGNESAKELLKRIQNENENLVSAETISNGETYSSVKESEIPFPLPDGWEWARLEEVCSLVVDIAHQMPKSVDDGIKFISAKDLLDDGTINFERNIKLISEEDFENLAKWVRPQRGDIIYFRIGARLGKARVVKTDEKFMISYSCCVVRPLLFDVEYLNFYLDSGIVLDQAQDHTKSIGVPDLGMKKIKSFLIAVPPLQEQQRIVARANELKRLCDELEARLLSAEEERGRLVKSVLAGVI